MTLGEFNKLMKDNNIPEDVTMLSDSGWECGPSDMDGIYYNEADNELVFVQEGNVYDRNYYGKPEWKLLHGKLPSFMKNWTKCSDKLPDMDVEVLGTINGEIIQVARVKSYSENTDWVWALTNERKVGCYPPDKIVAWKTLQKAYKESESTC